MGRVLAPAAGRARRKEEDRTHRAVVHVVLDEDGAKISLASLWEMRPGLLLLWRHLGCGCGMERAERLREEHRQYADAGLNVAIVAPGS